MNNVSFVLYLLCLLYVQDVNASIRHRNIETSRDVHIINESNVKVDLLWIHPRTQERTSNTEDGLLPGASQTINSYVDHIFEIKEMPPKKNQRSMHLAQVGGGSATSSFCRGPNGLCRTAYFKVSEREDQMVTINADLTIDIADSRTRALDKAKQSLEGCKMIFDDVDKMSNKNKIDQINMITQCMETKLNTTLVEAEEGIVYEAVSRKRMGQKLIKYACNDPLFNVSEPLKTENYRMTKMKQYFNTQDASIVIIDNLIPSNSDLCSNIHNEIISTTTTTTTTGDNDGNNPTTIVPWSAIKNNVNIYSFVKNKLYPILQHLLSYEDLEITTQQKLGGQPLFEVVLSGHEEDEEEGDKNERGRPSKKQSVQKLWKKTDMKKSKKKVMKSSRNLLSTNQAQILEEEKIMAQLILFCDVPSEANGGALHFPETGTHIKPQAKQGLLITHRNPNTGHISENLIVNEYMQCPIINTGKEGKEEEEGGNNNKLTAFQHNIMLSL